MPDDNISAFMALISALGPQGAHEVPPADAEDLQNGALHIPFDVTDARRLGQTVAFIRQDAREHWYWQMPSGERIYHN